MPFSTFFADGGIAFHGGDPSRSSGGCIRRKAADAEAVFDDQAGRVRVPAGRRW
jgi:hypothetical protein